MSFETLHISVLMKAKFCYGCLAWKNGFFVAKHSYLVSNLSGRKQFYIRRLYKRNQQDSANLFSSRVGVIYWIYLSMYVLGSLGLYAHVQSTSSRRSRKKLHFLLRFTTYIISEPVVLIYSCKQVWFKNHLLLHTLCLTQILHFASLRRVHQTSLASQQSHEC